METQKKYTKEFKEAAVDLILRGEKSASEVSMELGVCAGTLSRWVQRKREDSEHLKAFPGRGVPRDEEVSRLKKRIADLEETNEILKKAMAIFAEKKPR